MKSKTTEEILLAPRPEQEAWLLDRSRTPRQILKFTKSTSTYADIHALADITLRVRISEISERSTRFIIYLTVALLVLTVALLVYTIFLYEDARANTNHYQTSSPQLDIHP